MLPTLIALTAVSKAPQSPLVTIDKQATLRWTRTGKEVALFGANYCLPSALDYRAAGLVGGDRKAMIRQDLTHFARMGWDAVRLSFWGDWESCDKEGNLIANDHLDLLDYLVAEGVKRGMYFLLSPIITYDARWPEMKDYPASYGFSRYYDRSKLGTDPDAIRAQQNYLRQILNHVNPYTGRALKDEPSILFVEMINEPWHHTSDFQGSVDYINALVQAVRDTGCTKPTFHNVSQDFNMARAINQSQADGTTYSWYPTALNHNRELVGNWLPYVDDYAPMKPAIQHVKPTLVYEFDMGDTDSSYAYPAMVREFRKTGAQFAAMFSYDMLATSATNLGWQTHLLNLVYTPKKAIGGILAAEAMRRLPRYQDYGRYPASRRFGDFRVDGVRDHSELSSEDTLIYSSDTKTPTPHAIRKLIGLGSSPAVRYPGSGVYFLDRIDAERWRLEVYPDVIKVGDPFRDPKLSDTKFRLLHRTWPMRVNLPGLGPKFTVQGLNDGNSRRTLAKDGAFSVRPGVYLLSAAPKPRPLPSRVAGLGLREFVCPPSDSLPPQIVLRAPRYARVGRPVEILADVVATELPATLQLKVDRRTVTMRSLGGGRYGVTTPLPLGTTELVASTPDLTSPSLNVSVFNADTVVQLFDAKTDHRELFASRSAPWNVTNDLGEGSNTHTKAITLRPGPKREPVTVSADLVGNVLPSPKNPIFILTARGLSDDSVVDVTLVDIDGNAGRITIPLTMGWQPISFLPRDLKRSSWEALPAGYPGSMPTTIEPWAKGKFNPTKIAKVQFTVRAGTGVNIQGLDAVAGP